MSRNGEPGLMTGHHAAETIVVMGAGQAGGWAVRTLRGEGFRGRVILIGDESHPPHERPPLSKAVLAGTAGPETVHLITSEALKGIAVEWQQQTRVVALDRLARRLILANGAEIRYDKLIVCTGGRARKPVVPGIDLNGVFTLRTIEDSLAMGRAFESARRLLVVGGGWIGLEVAATARKKGIDVTVIEAMPLLCARSMPPTMSGYLRCLHQKNGTKVHLGCGLASIERGALDGLSITTTTGREFHGDVVVIGIGLEPNDEIAREAGIHCDGGILVDDRCRTSDPAVFAAGDVAVAPSRWSNRPVRLESWQNAQDQGAAAARAALGHHVCYDPLPWFWSDQYNVNLQIFGLPAASQRLVVRGDIEADRFVAFCLQEDRVTAAVGVNAARELRFARRLIQQAKSVREEDLVDSGVALATL